jgi:hypothetical protein
MGLNMDTMKDLVGNVADDAKEALDDILERQTKQKGAQAAPAQGMPARADFGGGAGAAGAAAAVGELPAQISRLSEQIDALTQLLESLKESMPSLPGESPRRSR